jgi:exodeoxyribonuclease VII large subunit
LNSDFFSMQENIITLFDLTLMLESTIDDSFGGQYFWVTAEISSINVRRGHCYLNLIEKDPGSAFPKAEMKGIIWQNNFERLNEKFSSVTGFGLKQDISILFLASVNFSPRYGLSINIFDLKAEYTLGEMMLDRQQTIEQLVKKGLYDLNRTIPLPDVPQRIAVLSATDSKGFEDFINLLKNNPHQYSFFVKMFPVMLQGNKAAESITSQIHKINSESNRFDIVALVRGGGGNVDLHCFNSFILAESIAKCTLPVITGIGHTTDYTVADEVAAVHKETPTAVAQWIVSTCHAYEEQILESNDELMVEVTRLMDSEHAFLEKSAGSILYKPIKLIGNENLDISKLFSIISSKSVSTVKIAYDRTFNAENELKASFIRLMKKEYEKFQMTTQILKAHDPVEVLKKGYSITRKDGITVKSSDVLSEGDVIETTTEKGKFESIVKNLKQIEN